jgi:acetylglutamate kinase
VSASSLVVIKYGGSLLEDEAHQSHLLTQVAALSRKQKVALVHGGGKEITKALETSGIATRFVNGRRFTDRATMAVVEKTLAGINQRIVDRLGQEKISAGGFSGRSQAVLIAKPIAELGCVGEPERVNMAILQDILDATDVPVFYSVAQDAAGEALNMNADDFALALAVAARVSRLVFLTDTGGILDKAGHPVTSVNGEGVERLIADGTITGGMAVKARACVDALARGVGRVDIAKGIESLLSGKESVDGTSFLEATKR